MVTIVVMVELCFDIDAVCITYSQIRGVEDDLRKVTVASSGKISDMEIALRFVQLFAC